MASIEKDDSLLQLATSVVPRMGLQEISLVHSSIIRARHIPVGEEGEFELRTAFKVHHEFDSGKLDVYVSFQADGSLSTGNDRLELFAVTSEFLVSYAVRGETEFDETSVEAFSKLNGTYNAWPYWREYLQSCTIRMGLPPAVVPLASVQGILDSVKRQEAKMESLDEAAVVQKTLSTK